jgi:hypothetical protein
MSINGNQADYYQN